MAAHPRSHIPARRPLHRPSPPRTDRPARERARVDAEQRARASTGGLRRRARRHGAVVATTRTLLAAGDPRGGRSLPRGAGRRCRCDTAGPRPFGTGRSVVRTRLPVRGPRVRRGRGAAASGRGIAPLFTGRCSFPRGGRFRDGVVGRSRALRRLRRRAGAVVVGGTTSRYDRVGARPARAHRPVARRRAQRARRDGRYRRAHAPRLRLALVGDAWLGAAGQGHDMTGAFDAVVIGAGPYGLALSGELRRAGVDAHVFGEAMSFWMRYMPKGMRLRSRWNASHIGDPKAQLSLDTFERERATRIGRPVPVADFIAYGRWFQARAVPDLDPRAVRRIEVRGGGFRVVLADGEPMETRRVVVAAGIAPFAARPAAFDGLPAELASHSVDHSDLAPFAGRRVAVIGGGQSAIESAVLLRENGADVEVIMRARRLRWVGRAPRE